MTDTFSPKPIASRDRLIFALDVPTADDAQRLITQLGDSVSFYKLGLQLFLSGDYFRLVDQLTSAGKQVFADLKLFDIPATVAAAVRQLERYPISLTTVHGNDAMLRAAAQAADRVKVLAVTALTSLDRGDLDDLGFRCELEELVLSRARRALELGCAGVVSSGLEVQRLRAHVDHRLLVVCPGIRPVDNDDDQRRTVDVAGAFANGADYIVVGRPIRDARDPRQAAETIQQTIADSFQ
ncbi:MAG: orotidine-5'-phosphate decarboxylase [Xanthomonadales bacterium]|nr:orotidine-5'-phosphate decarboxylase [Xanthomonadales bacterium]